MDPGFILHEPGSGSDIFMGGQSDQSQTMALLESQIRIRVFFCQNPGPIFLSGVKSDQFQTRAFLESRIRIWFLPGSRSDLFIGFDPREKSRFGHTTISPWSRYDPRIYQAPTGTPKTTPDPQFEFRGSQRWPRDLICSQEDPFKKSLNFQDYRRGSR